MYVSESHMASRIKDFFFDLSGNNQQGNNSYFIINCRNQTNDNTVDLPRCCPASFVGQFAQTKCLQSQDAKHPGNPLHDIFDKHLCFSSLVGQQFK